MSTLQHERARVAALTRSRAHDDPTLIDARRNLLAARLENYIKKVVDDAPPLTDEQREQIARLLRPSMRSGGGLDGAA